MFRPNVLIVDDDVSLLNVLGRAFSRLGTEPTCMRSSRQASELIEKRKFDGVVLDWRMPEMDGAELAQRIRQSKSNAHCPIIVLTGVLERDVMTSSFQAGASFFLQKPAGTKELHRLMAAATGAMWQERLRYGRVATRQGVVCQWRLNGESRRTRGRTVDVSASGMLARLDAVPPVGAEVELEFSLPGARGPLTLAAKAVRHAADGQAGFQFVRVSEEQREALQNFVKAALNEQAETVLAATLPTLAPAAA
jgi:CheY-like chemotaxis protein